MSAPNHKIRVGITMGDLNGIGPELIIKTFLDNRMCDLCTPVIYGSSKVINFYRKLLGIQDFNVNLIGNSQQAHLKRANLINCWEEDVNIEPGIADTAAGKYAYISLERAVEGLKKNQIDVLVTAPVNKQTIQQEGFSFPGHTEYLENRFNAKKSLMLMVNGNLRVGVITGHVPVKNVSELITPEKILEKLSLIDDTLRKDFRIRKPMIAILGLNPHAGDQGVIGNEEQEIISPAIQKAKEQGLLAFGPYPADGFFGNHSFTKFDAVLAMYHDQGLIPFKALSFNSGVNYTAGLPVIRTSPAHGTGYDIAGKNVASDNSFREAIYLACDIFKRREEYLSLKENPLKISKFTKDFSE